MNNPYERKPFGVSGAVLRSTGLVLLLLGVGGRSLLQIGVLNVQAMTAEQLSEAMKTIPEYMAYMTISVFLEALYVCAVPFFAFLLVEGFQRTRSVPKYITRIAILAAVCELPFNLAMKGSWLAGGLNPVFGLLLSLVMLYFYSRYQEKALVCTLVKAVVTVAAFLWALMLRIDQGACLVVIVAVLWGTRE